jgi:hypothetical protein
VREGKEVVVKARTMKALGAAGSAGALTLLCLIGPGRAASASPAPVQPWPAVHLAAVTVPSSFQPTAASFVSAAWGVVLGGSGCTGSRACRAQLAVTADGGAHWSVMRGPAVWLGGGGSSLPQVSQVVFADRADGWLYGSGSVWATHNGGASWRESTLPGIIGTIAASAHAVYAVVGSQLYSSPLGRNAWRRVSAGPGSGPVTGNVLAVWGTSVWFGGDTSVWATADGVHWARNRFGCSGVAYGEPYTLAGISAASARDVAVLCAAPQGMFHTVMKVLVSATGARGGWQALKVPPAEGDVAGFAAAPGGFGLTSIAVVTPGLDAIFRLPKAGQSWTTFGIPGTSGGAPLNSLQFMSPAVGSFVVGDPAVGIHGELLRTTDAGQTWHPVKF